jgi:hypothetical protein
VRPQEGDTPATYLLREYTHAHGAALHVPGVRIKVTLDHAYRFSATRASVDLHLYAQRGQIRDLRALRRTLAARDRTLFGRLMYVLREVLASFAPLYTGLDAIAGEETLLMGDDWESMIAEALFEATHRDDLDPSYRDLVRWAERQGLMTPRTLAQKFPRSLWTDPAHVWLPLLPRLEAVRDLPGIPEVLALLTHLDSLPADYSTERRWWRDGVHPGRIDVIICQAEGERDPVLESYREMEQLFMDAEDEEPLVVLEVTSPEDHARALDFLTTCRDVRERAAAMWAALGT